MPEAPRLVVIGGAGSGKSTLIKCLNQWLQKILQKPGDDPQIPYILSTATTSSDRLMKAPSSNILFIFHPPDTVVNIFIQMNDDCLTHTQSKHRLGGRSLCQFRTIIRSRCCCLFHIFFFGVQKYREFASAAGCCIFSTHNIFCETPSPQVQALPLHKTILFMPWSKYGHMQSRQKAIHFSFLKSFYYWNQSSTTWQ